jgi:hypothetical protein
VNSGALDVNQQQARHSSGQLGNNTVKKLQGRDQVGESGNKGELSVRGMNFSIPEHAARLLQ